jgi:hypothetical protein
MGKMPVSIARKLQAQKALQFPTFDFIVQPVALTLEDVIRLRLPTAMVDKKDARRKRWQQRFAPPLIEAGLLPESARWTEEDDAEDAAEKRGRLQRGEKRQAKGPQTVRRVRPLRSREWHGGGIPQGDDAPHAPVNPTHCRIGRRAGAKHLLGFGGRCPNKALLWAF